MNEAMITWSVIACLLAAIFVLRAIAHTHTVNRLMARLHRARHNSAAAPHAGGKGRHMRRHIIEVGKNSDIFYLPGDNNDDEECEVL